jgi:hypothetical protein
MHLPRRRGEQVSTAELPLLPESDGLFQTGPAQRTPPSVSHSQISSSKEEYSRAVEKGKHVSAARSRVIQRSELATKRAAGAVPPLFEDE